MTFGFCSKKASGQPLLMLALILSSAVYAEVINHKKLGKDVRTKVKQLRKVTSQIEQLKVDAGEAKQIRWDDICSTNIPLKETSACQHLAPQVWFEPFYPATNQFLAPMAPDDSQENSNDFHSMCVEKQGPCATVFKKTSQSLRTLLQMKPDQPCRQCIDQSYDAAIHSMHTHVIASLADTVQTLRAFAAHTNSTAATNLATQRAERITQDILPMLTADRMDSLYAYHVARMVVPQATLTAPEEIAMVTACCGKAVSLPSALTTWFTTAIAYTMVAVAVFVGLWAWQASYQSATKVASCEVVTEPKSHVIAQDEPVVEKGREIAAARSIQTTWKNSPKSPKATSRALAEPSCLVAMEPVVPPVMETAPLAISWRRAAPLPTKMAPGKDVLLKSNIIVEPTDTDSGLTETAVTRKDSESETDDSLPDLVPQQLSPRLIAEKKQSRGWMMVALVVLLIAMGLGFYVPENDGYDEVVVQRAPPKPLKRELSAANLGGSYGPMMPFRSKV